MVTVPFGFDHKTPCKAGNPVCKIKENFRKAIHQDKKSHFLSFNKNCQNPFAGVYHSR